MAHKRVVLAGTDSSKALSEDVCCVHRTSRWCRGSQQLSVANDAYAKLQEVSLTSKRQVKVEQERCLSIDNASCRVEAQTRDKR